MDLGCKYQERPNARGPWMGRVEMESMQAGSRITFIESLVCARHWGPWGRRVGTSPGLLGEERTFWWQILTLNM